MKKNRNFNRVLSYYKNHKILMAWVILFALIETLTFLFMPFVLKYFIDDALNSDNKAIILKTMGSYLIVILLIVIFQFLWLLFNKIINEKVVVDIKLELTNTILNADHTSYNKYEKGEMLSYFQNDTNALAGNISTAITTILECSIRLVIALTVLTIVDYKLLLFVLMLLPLYLLDARIINKPLKRATNSIQEANEIAIQEYEKLLNNRSGIVVNKKQNYITELIESSVKHLAKKAVLSSTWQNTSFSVGLLIYWLAMITVYVIGGFRVVDGLMTIGTLLFYIQYIDNIFMPSKQLLHVNVDFQKAMVSADRIIKLEENLKSRLSLNQILNFDEPISSIEVKNLAFAYDKKDIINNVNFKYEPGDIVGIVGRSGIGKTTLVKILSNLTSNYKGDFKINGRCFKTIHEHDLYDKLSIVFQEPFILSSTIKDNIFISQVSTNKVDSLVENFIDILISEFPNGVQSQIGLNGGNISGGQKQRIALARQFVSNAHILLFDEPTASLDYKNKKMVLEIIKLLSEKGKIILIISHDECYDELYTKTLKLSNTEIL